MTIEVILFCSLFGLFIMASYTLGLRNGQKLAKRQEITLPEINPVKVVTEIKEQKEAKKEKEIEELNMMNIDNYDGTGLNQLDFPN